MTPESLERAQRVVETTIREQLDDIVFVRILVTPDTEKFTDDNDLDYLEIRAIYEGERERLRSRRTLKLRSLLRERLLEEGVTEFPVLYMTMKSEWEQHFGPA